MEKIHTEKLGKYWDEKVADIVMQIWRSHPVNIELGKHKIKVLMKKYKSNDFS